MPRSGAGDDARDHEKPTFNARPPVFSPDGAVITVISGKSKGASARIPGKVGGSLRVGKASDNDLVLDDSTVSRHHLGIERASDGIVVRDLRSTNGVRVGGALITEARVGPGTIVRVGQVELLIGVELAGAALPASIHHEFGLAVGTSPPMRRIFGVLERMAATPASMLLIGETGTGKDLLARSIHMKSARVDGPFEVVDCGAIAATLIESELFGHERGAFTGAVSAREGVFERAAGGTLFLDEIGELAIDLQPKLLRVLESGEFRRVGGTKTLAADVRVIAATTRELARAAEEGTFRDDLYYRLAVVTLRVPPLRERLDDLPLVAEALLRASDPSPPGLSEAVLSALKSYDWPGNVRELRNVLERALYASRATGSGELRLVDFPPPERTAAAEVDNPVAFRETDSYREARARVDAWFEKMYVEWLLARHDGNLRAAARAARMDRNHLSDLARKHGVSLNRRS